MLSGEEVGAVVDWMRAVRRAMAGLGGAAAADAGGAVVPPTFGRPAEFPLEALECYPGRECPVVVTETAGSWPPATAEGTGSWDVDEAPGASGDLACVNLVWGVDVPWQKPLVFNARIESALAGSGMWREAMAEDRCIVPVRAFYETRNVAVPDFRREGDHDVEQGVLPGEGVRAEAEAEAAAGETAAASSPAADAPKRPRGRRPQYRFAATGGTALLLAGLRIGDRFALVTCEPDAVVGAVHSRMPLSLTAPEALAWLNPTADARALLAAHRPIPLTATEEAPRPKAAPDPDQMSLF